MRPSARREVVGFFQAAYGGRRRSAIGPSDDGDERRAVKAGGSPRSSRRRRSRRDPRTALRIRPRDLAAARVRYGYRRLHVLLRRQGRGVNHKRGRRLYREEGLSIRPKTPRRKRAVRYRAPRPAASAANQVRAME